MDRYAKGTTARSPVLYEGLELKLRTFLLRLSGAVPVAEDLLQETFMRMHRAREDSIGGHVSFLGPTPSRATPGSTTARSRTCACSARENASVAARDSDPPAGHEPLAGPKADSEQAAIARKWRTVRRARTCGAAPAQRELRAFALRRAQRAGAADVLGSTPHGREAAGVPRLEALRAALGPRPVIGGGGDGE